MCLATQALCKLQPGASPQGFTAPRKPLALKARFTREVIRSIISTALISASDIFGIQNLTELTPPKAFGVGYPDDWIPRAKPQACVRQRLWR
jgi:hypothetical protein